MDAPHKTGVNMAIEYLKRRRPYRVVVRINGQKKSRSFLRKADAENWQRQVLLSRDTGSAPTDPRSTEVPQEVSLDALRRTFELEYCESRQASSTRLMEGALYKKYVAPFIGGRNIATIKRKHISDFLLHLVRQEKLSNERANRVRTMLHCMFGQAVLWELVEFNPVSATRPFPQKNFLREEVINYLSQEEVSRLLDWLEENDPWLYPKVRVLVNTGMRYGEMAALQVRDLVTTAEGGRLSISRTYCRHSGEIKNRTKGRKSRSLPLGVGMFRLLSACIAGKDRNNSLLWESIEEFRHPTKFRNHFVRALEETKVRPIRIHDLRHTFAVHFLENGGQLYDLQKLLGHHSVRLTERYSHFSNAMSERARGLVDHHGSPSNPRALTVIDGGVRSALSHKCPTNASPA